MEDEIKVVSTTEALLYAAVRSIEERVEALEKRLTINCGGVGATIPASVQNYGLPRVEGFIGTGFGTVKTDMPEGVRVAKLEAELAGERSRTKRVREELEKAQAEVVWRGKKIDQLTTDLIMMRSKKEELLDELNAMEVALYQLRRGKVSGDA
jgi:hypothetical protein